MTRKGFLAAAAGVAATLAASTVAFAQTNQTQPQPQSPNNRRGEVGSARNLKHVRARLERLIDELDHDQTDYGGYRVKAVEAMKQARGYLDQALQWDATHSH